MYTRRVASDGVAELNAVCNEDLVALELFPVVWQWRGQAVRMLGQEAPEMEVGRKALEFGRLAENNRAPLAYCRHFTSSLARPEDYPPRS